MRVLRVLCLLILTLSIGVVGCGQTAAPPPKEPAASKPAEKPKKDTLVFGDSGQCLTMDPLAHRSIDTFAVLDHIYDTPVYRDHDQQIKPRLAESWKQIDEVTWEFKLRKGVKFHDGEPFNAEAFKFSLDRNIETGLKYPPHSTMTPIASCQIVDEYTVRIITKGPYPGLLAALVIRPSILPPKYIQKNGWDYLHLHPNGTGPYKLVQWDRGTKVVLEANPDYFGGAPSIKQIVWRTIPENATRAAELMTGGIDAMRTLGPEMASLFAKLPDVRVVVVPGTSQVSIAFKNVGPLKDKRVRQALNYAVDREKLVKTVLGGLVRPDYAWVASDEESYDPAIEKYSYNIEKAKALLKEAGYEKGFKISVAYSPGDRNAETAQAVAGELAKIGVTLDLQPREAGLLATQVRDRKIPEDAWLGSSANPFMLGHKRLWDLLHSGYSSYFSSPETDKRTDAALMILDPEKQKKELRELHAIAMDLSPALVLYTFSEVSAARSNLKWDGYVGFMPMFWEASFK